jgi:hypothetical protein
MRGDTNVGEQGTSYFGVFRTTGPGLDNSRAERLADLLAQNAQFVGQREAGNSRHGPG